MIKHCTAFLCGLLILFLSQTSRADPIRIVAAENFYGNLAKEIGGSHVQVDSIIRRSDQDPHLFSLTPGLARRIQQADLVVFNGLGYDAWIQNALIMPTKPMRTVICVAQLVHRSEGENPHIWYDPVTMPAYAKALFAYLSNKDPRHRADYHHNCQRFLKHYAELTRLIDHIRPRSKNIRVLATEPVFAYMAKALGFDVQGVGFQTSVMNDTDPGPRQTLEFQKQLQTHRVSILFYNKQVDSPLMQQLLKLAKASGIPVVGLTETQPDDKTYSEWMISSLKRVDAVLDEQHHLS